MRPGYLDQALHRPELVLLQNVPNPFNPHTVIRYEVPAGGDRVVRGGSWSNGAHGCRSANRLDFGPDGRNFFVGFRLSRSVALGP